MMKKSILAMVAIFVVWCVLDYVMHGVILQSTYEATSELWRPEGEMRYGLIYFTVAVSAVVFTLIYTLFFAKKNLKTGALYGLLAGLAIGISMGYGTYAVMPVPYTLPLVWFLGTVVESVIAGLLVGAICKDPPAGQQGE